MSNLTLIEKIRTKFNLLRPLLNERLRRHWAASESLTLPRGGIGLVAQATGLSRTTIWTGQKELRRLAQIPPEGIPPDRVRTPGGGRHLIEDGDPTVRQDLEALVECTTRGDPQSPLRWTCKSTRNLAEELNRLGHHVSHVTVA